MVYENYTSTKPFFSFYGFLKPVFGTGAHVVTEMTVWLEGSGSCATEGLWPDSRTPERPAVRTAALNHSPNHFYEKM